MTARWAGGIGGGWDPSPLPLAPPTPATGAAISIATITTTTSTGMTTSATSAPTRRSPSAWQVAEQQLATSATLSHR